MATSFGPYRVAASRVVYDRSLMQLAGGACRCANGDILAYYNRLPDAAAGNEAYFLRSDDEGVSWECTALPLASRHEEGAVHVATGMVTLPNGTILLPFADYQSGRTSPEEHPKRLKDLRRSATLHLAVSTDHAHHWDDILDVPVPFDFVYPYGQLFRALDGALCLPMLISTGTSKTWLDDYSASGFLVSRDEGRSWGDWRVIVPSPNPHRCVETTVTPCADGSILALHRNDTPTLRASRSRDDGETWSDPQPTNLHGECGCVIRDSKGRLVVAYRSHRKAPADAPMGMIVVVSEDHGETWSPEAVLPDPKGRVHKDFHETGMPDIFNFPDGRIGIVYYSYDPNLPFVPPANDELWRTIPHIYKRYIALAILEEA
ncbi:MAG: exo-alpha-sialidase [Phycisphaerae bacterium]|nr:exo-alpha-sialidase [Phycisphaerae bacterium]